MIKCPGLAVNELIVGGAKHRETGNLGSQENFRPQIFVTKASHPLIHRDESFSLQPFPLRPHSNIQLSSSAPRHLHHTANEPSHR